MTVETTITDTKTPPAKPARVRKPRAGATNVLLVGYGVLVPLVAMAMVIVMTYPNAGADAVLKVEITYAATLLSFLGGIRWGIALMAGQTHLHFRPLVFVTLVLPLAWAILFMSPVIALPALMAGYMLIAFGERMGKKSPVPDWYHRLLVPFTVMVEIALGLSLLVILGT
ncbi:MAG: DUF3429 domain-containing protein [Parvibaculum sp.]|nr:DUF3429 domain-containing protein [Parvibaculum sp.]